ncbi:cyclic nucleotide-binding domain protein (macronuclear) [Tetrahymena thermophila SB210]|uniref:Cyclic nucleotide-binding domain protein n=1 Tax=Tetrahymena thermophila (strain SB210) TaxID=312017 RepID=Q22UC5_TETTS|nr:cyclic nucleotide-binding domain protein [Tetrahymena thermophila SB210]EAR88762.2 cyclic nucleotide-binding domain protein [Tetrahymena thermophila SB210]|eukprot:XP_001009007.2 cyclic nucleotide-binding domain protein [Tetrahymena thermophila SB210]
MIKLVDSNKDQQQQNDQMFERKSSLSHIANFQSEKIIDNQIQSHIFGHRAKLSSLDCILIPNSPKKKFRQKLKQQDFISFTSTYMKRGTLDSDMLDLKNDDQLNEKDYIILEILRKKIVDVKQEEDSNMAIYILRKVTRNPLEIQFLKKVIESIPLFQKNPDLSKNCSNQILMKISHSYYKKNQVIFNYGDHGSVFYLILKGSVYCLIPNKDYKTFEPSEESQNNGQNQKEKVNTQQSEKQSQQTDQQQRNRKKLIIGGQPHNLKRMKSQEGDLHEFDLESGTYEPPKSPLKRNKLLLKPNRSQSFSDLEEETDEMIKKRQKEENKKFIQSNYPEFDIIKELKQGDSFGEIAVLTGEKRTATMICSEDTHLLALSKKGFDTILGAYKQFIMQETVEFLRKIPFLQSIPSSQLLSLFQSVKEEKYVMGNQIYTEKDKPNCIYFVKSGEIEVTKEIQAADGFNDDKEVDYQEYNKRMSFSEVEKAKIFGFQKKKSKQRVRLYLLGPHSYFGEQEIMKKLPLRETQARCNSQEAIIYSIEKKDFFVFMKVHKHFQMFKKEIQIKMEWEDERDKNLVSKSQQNKLMLRITQPQHNKPSNQEEISKKTDVLQGKYTAKDSDSNISSQQNTVTSFSIKSQRKVNDFNSITGQQKNESQPSNDYFSQQSHRYYQQQSQTSTNFTDQIKNDLQHTNQNDIFQLKSARNKLPVLQSNFIDSKSTYKNQRSSSLNQLIQRQNKPIIDALVSLKNKGCDITQLSKLSIEELKNISRLVHKSNIQIGQTNKRKSLILKECQDDINESELASKFKSVESQQQQQRHQIQVSQNNNQSSSLYPNTQVNQDDLLLSKQQNIQTQNPNQVNKSKMCASLRQIDINETTQTSSKKISMLLRKSFDYSNSGYNSVISAIQSQRGNYSPNNHSDKIQQKETPQKQKEQLFNSPQNDYHQKQQIGVQTLQNEFGNYSIFNGNKARSKTDQFTALQRPKNVNQPCKGSTLHIEKQVAPHYKFEEELMFKNNKKINKNKEYFDKDNTTDNSTTIYLLGKKSESKLGITAIQKLSQVENHTHYKGSDNQDIQLQFKSPRNSFNTEKIKSLNKEQMNN